MSRSLRKIDQISPSIASRSSHNRLQGDFSRQRLRSHFVSSLACRSSHNRSTTMPLAPVSVSSISAMTVKSSFRSAGSSGGSDDDGRQYKNRPSTLRGVLPELSFRFFDWVLGFSIGPGFVLRRIMFACNCTGSQFSHHRRHASPEAGSLTVATPGVCVRLHAVRH